MDIGRGIAIAGIWASVGVCALAGYQGLALVVIFAFLATCVVVP